MNTLAIIRNDPWLKPFEKTIVKRIEKANEKEKELAGDKKLKDFATGHLFFGLHRTGNYWIFRERAPNATEIFLIGKLTNWKENEKYKLSHTGNGNWEINLPENTLKHGDLYRLSVHWEGGKGDRIPSYAKRVVQDEVTKIFNAQVWAPDKPYLWKQPDFTPDKNTLLIYEAHVGMATEEEKTGSFEEFRKNVLPRVAKAGYNAIQLMAIQEHPYYGSFGYHVSNLFAVSS
ncbi:MAG: 1,4-alpha-glucan-branching enzyme, partial [Bacteroidales bacterium]|nr:1,4-alpha-glucan-branching enzyme [Bacteroidales bacterium]